MAPQIKAGASVLIIDPDAAIRRLVETVLKRSGFRTESTGDLETAAPLLETSSFSVILLDLNLAPAASRRSLERLAATAPELLRRTVIMTTKPARAAAAVGDGAVFAIVSKPFDLQKLMDAVNACAQRSSDTERREPVETPPVRRPRPRPREADGGEPSTQLASLRRFAVSVPSLQQLLSVPVSDHREAALRTEMRRTLGVLSATLREAARGEASTTRAAVFRAASTAASRLATVAPPARGAGSAGRDH